MSAFGNLNRLGSSVSALAKATGLHPRQVRSALSRPDDAPFNHVVKLWEADGVKRVDIVVTFVDGGSTATSLELCPDRHLWVEGAGDAYTDRTPAVAVKLSDAPDSALGRAGLRDRAQRSWRMDRGRLAQHDPKHLLAVRRDVIVGAWEIRGWSPGDGRVEFDLGAELPAFLGQRLVLTGQAPARYLP